VSLRRPARGDHFDRLGWPRGKGENTMCTIHAAASPGAYIEALEHSCDERAEVIERMQATIAKHLATISLYAGRELQLRDQIEQLEAELRGTLYILRQHQADIHRDLS
jgi:hypothetical protein